MNDASAEISIVREIGSCLGDSGLIVHDLRYSSSRSRIFYATSSPGNAPLAIKLFTDGTSYPQIEAVQSIDKDMRRYGEFSVPEPIYMSDDGSVVVTEWVEAESLRTILRRHGFPISKILSFSNRAGRWLRHFHRTVRTSPGNLKTKQLLEDLEDELKQLRNAGTGFPKAIEKAHAALVSSASWVAREPVSQGQIHGDFKPDNILISESRTVGIDFSLEFRNVVVLDLAHFINHLILHTYEPRAFRWFYSRHIIMNAFVQGYTDKSTILNSSTLAWIRLFYFVRMWCGQVVRSKIEMSSFYLCKAICHEINILLAGRTLSLPN